MTAETASLAFLVAVALALMAYWRLAVSAHRTRLDELDVRVHVNGIRGKSTVTRLVAGVLRAVSDDAGSTIEGVDSTVHPDGRTDVVGLVRWVAAKRGDAVRSLRDALTALRALEKVA